MKGTLNINLASQPFQRNRPMLVASIATAALMAAVLSMLVYLISVESGEGEETAAAIAETRQRLQALVSEETTLQTNLRRPENEAVLDTSMFLNSLLMRKSISWTLIFQDLEKVLPYNVKVVQVRPQINTWNEIQLEMVVASQTTEPVIEMLQSMEDSDVFSSTSVSVALPPTDSEPFFRYRVSVNYERQL